MFTQIPAHICSQQFYWRQPKYPLIDKWLNGLWFRHGIAFGNKKEQAIDTCSHQDELQEYYYAC